MKFEPLIKRLDYSRCRSPAIESCTLRATTTYVNVDNDAYDGARAEPRSRVRRLILEAINVVGTCLKGRVVRRSSAISSPRLLLARSYSMAALVTFNRSDSTEIAHRNAPRSGFSA